MTESDPSKGWWHTLPGVLTGITATLTALAGLIVAVHQTGWLSSRSVANDGAASATLAESDENKGAQVGTDSTTAQQRPGTSVGAAAIALPAMRDYKLGSAVFTLLRAALSVRNTETDTLAIQVRMLNTGSYGANFWDNEFRLLVDTIPRAPDSNLNKLVPAQAAEEGEVTFVVPRAATAVQLRITYGDEETVIPLNLVRAAQAPASH
jgi:hypothetical protein